MRLSKVFIDNYRSFVQFQTPLEWFTAIVGRNNTGKTSFVRALELLFHPGSDRTIPLSRDDFRRQDEEIIIEAIFDNLDQTDTQAFFSLEGSPGSKELGVRLEARWEDGEIVAERYVVRPDKAEDERKVIRYTRRYSQFLKFSYISPYRQPEQAERFTRGSDYRAVLSAYAGDFVQPIETLLANVKTLSREIQAEIVQRGGIDDDIYNAANDLLDEILEFITTSPVTISNAASTDDIRSSVVDLREKWNKASQACLQVLETAVEDGSSSITRDIYEVYGGLSSKVLKLLQRCQVQLVLLELRDSIIGSDDFVSMQESLSSLLDLLLPEMPPSLQPFPIQDDRLFNEVVIRLGDTDLLHCGSGYQSTFSIGLRVARILAEVSRGVAPRLLTIAIEEPEAHLHPQKQRHLISSLQDLQRQMLAQHGLMLQILVTTHSSNVLSGLSFEQAMILHRKAGLSQATKLERETFLENWLDDMGISGTNKRMRIKKLIERKLRDFFSQFSETLFARFALIVEGYSEVGAFPVWVKHLPVPNDLDQLGISLIVGGGAELSYAGRLLDNLGVDYLLVCDKGDEHDLSGIDSSRIKLTNRDDFEDEILAVLPMHKVLKAIEATLTETEVEAVYKSLASPAGAPELASARAWEDIVKLVKENRLSEEGLDQLRKICSDVEVGHKQRRHLLKGADIGSVLADEADTMAEIPPVYYDALKLSQKAALEIMVSE